jgi:hypothetical protein
MNLFYMLTSHEVYWQLLLKKITRISKDKMDTLFTGVSSHWEYFLKKSREAVAREGDSVY